jgi:stage II sporulation protein D
VPAAGATVAVPARSARYRGSLDVSAGGGGLRLVNVVGVEDYLRGMGEVRDSSWPRASLGAQAVAARTYALRAMAISGELCDTQDCQVYLGQQAEYGAMDAAVNATRGQVVRIGGALAQTVYSASGGGVSATPEEGFGTSGRGLSYLSAVPYPTRDPQSWTLRIPLRDLGRRVGYPGTVQDVRVAAAGPSGRPLTVALTGDAGPREVAALSFRDGLSLRSTLWSLRVEGPPAAPDQPPPVAGQTGSEGPRPAFPVVADAETRGRSLLSGGNTVVATETLRLPHRATSAGLAGLLLVGLYGALAYRLALQGSPRGSPGSDPA